MKVSYEPSARGDATIATVTLDNPDKRNALYRQAQEIIAKDAVNGYLFELAKTGVWDAKLNGLWENSPIQANDLTGVSWSE